VFPPDHDFKILWDIIGVSAILYQSIMIPYKISFKEMMKDPEPLEIIDIIIDCFFIIDICKF
jgi:hypothetical protein